MALYDAFASGLPTARCIVDYARLKVKDTINQARISAYIAECLRTLTNNVANGIGGSLVTLSLGEFLERAKVPPDNRTGEQVLQDFAKKAGIKVV